MKKGLTWLICALFLLVCAPVGATAVVNANGIGDDDTAAQEPPAKHHAKKKKHHKKKVKHHAKKAKHHKKKATHHK